MNRLRDETAFNSSTNSARLAEASHLNFRDLNQKAPDGKFNQARSPIPSTQYLGISTHNIQQSTDSVNTSNYIVKKSSEIVTHSSVKFKNSEDILAYLREHPQFQKLKNDRLDGIVAAIISGLSIAGGVAVIVVSGGTATPTVMLSSSLFISAGTSGLHNAINGIVNENFDWADWTKRTATSGGLTLITFGAGYVAGYATGYGLAVYGNGFTNAQIKAYGAIAGNIAGGMVRTSAYIIVSQLEHGQVDVFSLVLEGLSGLATGGVAGYTGAKGAIIDIREKPLMIKSIVQKVREGAFNEQDAGRILDTTEGQPSPSGRPAHSRAHTDQYKIINPNKPNCTLYLTLEDQNRSFANALNSDSGLFLLENLLEHPEVNAIIDMYEDNLEIIRLSYGNNDGNIVAQSTRIVCYAKVGPESNEILLHTQTVYPTSSN